MSKVWKFMETGEVRRAQREWAVLKGVPIYFEDSKTKNEYPILSLEVYDEDPMEGIRAVYGEFKKCCSNPYFNFMSIMEKEMWQAICRAVEGK